MKYEVKVQDRVVGTVERLHGWYGWRVASMYDAGATVDFATRTQAERYLVNRDTAQNSSWQSLWH